MSRSIAAIALAFALGACGNRVDLAPAAGHALPLAELQAIDARIGEGVFAALSVEASVAARGSHGGTAPAEVRERIAEAREALGMDR